MPKIKKISVIKDYNGKVHDLNVNNTNSYNIDGIAVHNSAAGSLVLYCIGVTGIDPIKYDLYFERFVSKARAKKIVKDDITYLDGSLMCDIDNDIAYEDRQKVVDYLYGKYPNHVASIMTFTTLSGKLCIKDCAKIIDEITEEEANQISESIPKVFGKVLSFDKAIEQSEKFSSWVTRRPETFKIANHLEGLIKNTGVHPSGIALSNQPIDTIVPIGRLDGGHPIACYDMNSVSKLMVKLDILGLRTLSVVDDTCKRLGINWKTIDVNHPSIYTALQNLDSPKGIFQIEADTNYEVCQKIKPQNIQELSDVIALARPGALAFVDEYIDVKNGNKQISEKHPKLDEILKQTKGTIIYQESLMRIAHEVFGFTLEDAEQIRRAVGKKIKKEVEKWESKIKSQAEKLSLPDGLADFYWKALSDSADYSFNKCLSPDSIVSTPNGERCLFQIKSGDKVFSFDFESNSILECVVSDIVESSTELFEFELEDGRIVTCSKEHKFMCEDGIMRPISEIISQKLKILCID